MSDGMPGPQYFPPVTDEDLKRLQVEPHLIPIIVRAAQRAEQSSNNETQLSPEEAGALVEILHTIVSSNTSNTGIKSRCFKILRKVSSSHGILPGPYYVSGVITIDAIPYASGGYADIWKGVMDGERVSIKAFRTQTTANLGKIKRRFFREIIGWKYISHPNVLSFKGVSESLFPFCIVSPWMPFGNIVEYVGQNKDVNRFELLTQASRGLEYLHSINIVHTDINPGNILINEGHAACLVDYGIAGVITDPTVVEPGSTTSSKPGNVRYMAPELLNPSQFGVGNSNPTKESDVYSFALTIYQVFTENLPFGNARDGIIIFNVVSGSRPPRPENNMWIRDPIWNMLSACWSERRGDRWDTRAVYNQLSVSAIQEGAEGEKGVRPSQIPACSSVVVEDPTPSPPRRRVHSRRNTTGVGNSVFLEEPPPPLRIVKPDPASHLHKPGRAYTAPAPRTSPISPRSPHRGRTFPVYHPDEREEPHLQPRRSRKFGMFSKTLSPFRRVVNAMRLIFRLRKSSATKKGEGRAT